MNEWMDACVSPLIYPVFWFQLEPQDVVCELELLFQLNYSYSEEEGQDA